MTEHPHQPRSRLLGLIGLAIALFMVVVAFKGSRFGW